MSEPLVVIAHFQAKPGLEARLRQQLLALVAPTRSEPGCLLYDLHQTQDDASRFVFYEIWRDESDLDAHLQTPHLQAMLKIAPQLVEGQIDITKWKKLI